MPLPRVTPDYTVDHVSCDQPLHHFWRTYDHPLTVMKVSVYLVLMQAYQRLSMRMRRITSHVRRVN